MNIELFIVLSFITLVGVIGFLGSKAFKSKEKDISEWSVASRKFGTFVVWFLIGGDVYTAYTLIAAPGLAYKTGVLALFATAYAIMTYPIVYLTMPRLWNFAHKHNLLTGADFSQKVFDSKLMGITVAVIGILAELPYIGLQIIGMELMLKALNVSSIVAIMLSLLLVIGFTVFSGLKGPALTAFIKDFLVWVVVISLLIYIPYHYFGGIENMFKEFSIKHSNLLVLSKEQLIVFISLSLGSAIALFLYPHSLTGVYSAKSSITVKKNAIFLPIYNIMLLFITFLGFSALLIVPNLKNPNMAFPMLVVKSFNPIIASLISSVVILGSMIPASIMSIASSNLLTRNILKNLGFESFIDKKEKIITQIGSIFIIVIALLFSLKLKPSFIITLQLIAGAWVVQLFSVIFIPLYTQKLSKQIYFISLVLGVLASTYLMYLNGFKSPLYKGIWVGLYGILIQLIVLLIFKPFFKTLNTYKIEDFLDIKEEKESLPQEPDIII